MKQSLILLLLLMCISVFSQTNNNPTIATCDGLQDVCATGLQFNVCVTIAINPTYTNLSAITGYEIDWGDGSSVTSLLYAGGIQPPNQNHPYNLSGFYGTCQEKKEYYIKLLTNHTPPISQTNSIFILTIRNPPIADLSISDEIICAGQSTTLMDASCPYAGLDNSNWNLGDGTSATNQTSVTHTYNNAGTYTVTHTISNSCGTDSETASILVLNPPIADVKVDSGALSGTPPVVCLGGGGIVKLNAGISLNETSYSWMVTPSSGWQWFPTPLPVPTGPLPRIKFNQAGTYTIKVTVNNDCDMPSEKSIEIKVVDAPLLNLNPQPDNCVPISYSPSPNNPDATYTINGIPQSNFPVSLAISPNPYIIVANLSNECGAQTRRDTFFLQIPQDVIISAPANNITVCTGSAPIPLLAAPAGGVWTGQNISQSMGNWVFTPPGSPGVFVIKYTRGSGNCERIDEVTITVEQSYNLQLTPQQDGCNSLSFTPSPNDPNVTYTLNGVAQTTFPVNLAVSNNTYVLVAEVTNTCGTKMLTDSFLVVAPVDVNILAPVQDTVVCQNSGNIFLLANPTDGTWLGQNISGPPGNTVFTPISVGTFLVIYTRSFGACERRDTIVIKVEESYNLQLAPQPDDCISLNYSPNPNDPNVTYTLNGVVQTSFPQTLTAAATPNVISATYTNTCGTKVLVDTFLVLDPTPVSILTPNDTIVCQNTDPLTLSAQPTGGSWIGQNINGTVFTPVSGGVFPLIYTRGSGNCAQRDTTQVEVITVAIEAGNNQMKCILDAPFQLSGFNPPSGGTWTGTGITSPTGLFDPGTAGLGSHVLNYEFSDPVLGCTFRDSMTITINPMPESNFAEPTATCINEEIQFENLSLSTFSALWDFDDGQTSTLVNPIHSYTDTGTYTIKLTMTTEFGCMDMVFNTIFVTEPPFAFFTSMPDSGCAVLPVFVGNQSYGWQTSYLWEFGTIYSDNTYAPGQVLLPGGTKDSFYIIILTATNLCAVRTWQDSILVFPLPIVDFGPDTDTVCSGATLLFANTTLGQPETFYWDFGNGITSTDTFPPPVQYFTDSLYRTYTIRLIATNFCGSDTLDYDITVKPVNVKAFFNVPNYIGCEPYEVDFTNYGTPGASVSWDFGDGNTSTDPNPTHTFTADGMYKVVQKVTSGCGYDSTIAFITVLPAPEVSFTSEPQVCRNDSLAFANTSQNLAGTTWFFGVTGDSSLLSNPSYTWTQAGTYPVTLVGISAANGCPAAFSGNITVLELPMIAFSPSAPDGCVPLTIAFTNQSQNATYFDWNFGDGNTGTGTTVSHTYYDDGQFTVYLSGIDLNGCRNHDTLLFITAHPIPNAAFTINSDRLCGVPVNVQTNNLTPDAVGYAWSFGNGGTSVLNDPATTYTTSGDYNVQLIATNSFGCRDTVSQPFSAYDIPVADFTWTPEDGCAPLEVQFTNLSQFSTNAYWTISNGAVSIDFSPSQWFYTPGIYGATLIASHRDVCFDTLQLDDIIFVKPSPWANFIFVENATTPPSGMYEFTDLSIDAAQWLWDFGDGATSEEQNPAHRYFSNGAKVVTLVVTSENGCTDDTSQVIIPTSMRGLFIPNAFTPGLNGDLASKFWPQGVGLREYKIAVYSSFGQELWSSDKLNEGQPAEGWDGTFKDEFLPQDVYVWKVITAVFEDGTVWEGNFDYGAGSGKKVGSVTLIR